MVRPRLERGEPKGCRAVSNETSRISTLLNLLRGNFMMQRFKISTFAMAVVGLVATLIVAPNARAQVVYQVDSGSYTELFNNSQGVETEDNFVGVLYTAVAGGTRLLSIDLGVGRNVPDNEPVSLAIYSFDVATYTRIATTETTVTGTEGSVVNLPLDNPVDLNEGDMFLAAVLMRSVPGDWFPFLNDGLSPHGTSYFDVGPNQGDPYDLDNLTNLTLLGDTHPVVGAGLQSPGDLFLRVEADVTP